MPWLKHTEYLTQWVKDKTQDGTISESRFDECIASLEAIGIKSDYDLLLQTDILPKAPPHLHGFIKNLRMVVLEHFAATRKLASQLTYNSSDSAPRIPSGITNLDTLLQGGIKIGEISEVCGDSGSGKTSLAIEIAASHLLSATDQASRVYYLQSSPLPMCRLEHTMRRRIGDNSESDEIIERSMERLFLIDCSDISDLLTFLYKYADAREAAVSADNEDNSVRSTTDLVVIDSIRPLIVGAIHLSESRAQIYAVRTSLRRITRNNMAPTAVLITNGISRKSGSEDSGTIFGGVRPSLNSSWAMISHLQLYVYKSNTDTSLSSGLERSHGQINNASNTITLTSVILKSPEYHLGAMSTFAIPV